jgi:Mg-chelatase subunit ChlD
MKTISRYSMALLIICAILSLLASCTSRTATSEFTPPPSSPASVVTASPVAMATPSPEMTESAVPSPAVKATSKPPKNGQSPNYPNSNNNKAGKSPSVEVVFVLDTTGSMTGLLNGAKQKIWSMANTLLQLQPKPSIKIGLVGYRDKGDEYITKVHGLSGNMDKVYENLMAFQAGGGGDTPEHVNKALDDALHQVQWTSGRNSLKFIFLVGDAPPHTDYQDGYSYKKVCSEARQRDIIIDTIRCGNAGDTEQYWREIASLGGGQYASIDQTGGMVAVTTPMDTELSALNTEMGKTLVPYGSKSERASAVTYQRKSEAMAPSLSAERAKFVAGSGKVADKDLVDAINNKEVNIAEMKPADLPEEMQGMDKAKREEYVREQGKKRDDLKKKIADVSKKRDKYIQEKVGAQKGSFDNQVLSFIREQAKGKGFTMKE